jgi:cysteine desulfurase
VSSLAIPDVDGQALLMALDMEGIAASGGSACDSGAAKGSHVIAAMYGDTDPYATVRFSLGRATTEEDIHAAVETTVAVVERIRHEAD